MDAQQSLEQLAVELRRRRLPHAYIERLLAELRDHMDDLNAQRSSDMNTARTLDADLQQRIGDPIQLAKFVAEQYHRRSFLGRHPILTFLIAPLPLVVLVWAACLLMLGVLFLWPVDLAGYRINLLQNPWLTSIGFSVLGWVMIVFPLVGTDLLLCRIARHNALRWRWPVMACVIVALLCSLLWTLWVMPMHITTVGDKPYEGQFIMCFGWPATWRTVASYGTNFACALGIGLLLVRRAQRLAVENQPADQFELRQAA